MTTFWFEDSWTVHRLVGVEAETEEAALEKLVAGSDQWQHEETNDAGCWDGWDQTTPEEFHACYGGDNDVWTRDGVRQLEKRAAAPEEAIG